MGQVCVCWRRGEGGGAVHAVVVGRSTREGGVIGRVFWYRGCKFVREIRNMLMFELCFCQRIRNT